MLFLLVAQDTPSNLMWFPSPQATMQRQQTIKKAMMCMRHLSSSIWKAASTFSRCKKKNDIQFQTKPTSRTLQCNGFCKRYDFCQILKSSETVYTGLYTVSAANSHTLICYTLHLPFRIVAAQPVSFVSPFRRL